MTGTAVTPAPVTGTVDMSTGQTLSPAYVNAFRISTVSSKLLAHVRGEIRPHTLEFCNLCLSLARGIDYAVSNNEIPSTPELPNLLKQVCQRKNDLTSQAAIMVLMISVKSACSNGWFNEKEKEELYVLSKEMQSSFCSVNVNTLNSNVKNKESNLHPTISTIMSRFYPGMKIGEIFTLVETTPGYDSYVTDLYIPKSSKNSPDDKIYLFVAQRDNVETSSCLINPQQVNFLLNGEGVDGRNCVYKDPGPQMPTPVTHLLKYGSNLLQVVGQFCARYIIVIGFMSVVQNPNFPIIPYYVPPVAFRPDNDIIEGPSIISLKCPISFNRIKIPVKGHSCNHLQCFDFNNYVEINSRRPLWRCPQCSQSVCFSDIRIDQTMVKVLNEVGEDVSYVKISDNGSWEAFVENISYEHIEKPIDAGPSNQEISTKNIEDIMHLTENDNEMDIIDKVDDKKPSPTVINNTQSQQNENANNNGNSHVKYQKPTAWIRRTQNAIEDRQDRQQNFSRSYLNPHMSSQNKGQRDHLPLSSQSQTSPQAGARSVSPQQTNGSLYTPPLSADRFNSNQHQSLNQRNQLPVRTSDQYSGVGTMTSLASSQTRMHSLAVIQRATSKVMSRSQSILPPTQTTGPPPVAATADQRGSSADGSAEENWRPSGRMRGSLTGWQYTEALKNQFIIQPSQPVQAARPPPILNTPRPFIPPHFQALMANNPRPQTAGSDSGPGSDSSLVGGPGSDK